MSGCSWPHFGAIASQIRKCQVAISLEAAVEKLECTLGELCFGVEPLSLEPGQADLLSSVEREQRLFIGFRFWSAFPDTKDFQRRCNDSLREDRPRLKSVNPAYCS